MTEHKLTKLYTAILEHIREFDTHFTEEKLEEALHDARQTFLGIGQYTAHEIDEMLPYIKRDLLWARYYIVTTGNELWQWLRFDVRLVEERLWDNFSKVADQTQIHQLELLHHLQHGGTYKTGQMIGLGTLQCENCGELLRFKKVTAIQNCPICEGDSFIRP